jgi:hypothetical protein
MHNSQPIRVAAINDVLNGGETLLDYIKFAIAGLPENCRVTVLQTPKQKVGLSPRETEAILGRPVTEITSYTQLTQLKDIDVVISNDSAATRYLDDTIFSILISHGSAPYPATSDYYFAAHTSYWDAVLFSSRASLEMASNGLNLFRKHRRALDLHQDPGAIRSDIRKTYLCHIAPIKKPGIRHLAPSATQQGSAPSEAGPLVIGLMPTGLGAMRPGMGLYSATGLLDTIIAAFPTAKIIFRPHPSNIPDPVFQPILAGLARFKGVVEVDLSAKSSLNFYQECDVLITDGSTGGVSYMLAKKKPPIYYLPQYATIDDPVIGWFADAMAGKVMLAGSLPELITCINDCVIMSESAGIAYYDRYCRHDLAIDTQNSDVFTKLFDPLQRDSAFTCVDHAGTIWPASPEGGNDGRGNA